MLPNWELALDMLPFWEQHQGMRIISHSTLVAFGAKRPDAMASLEAWYRVGKRAKWGCMNDVVATIPSADPVGPKHVVFNIAGNKYRLVATVYFPQHTLWVKFIGTHAQYDKLKVKEQ